jgi:hypothetical protein
MTFQRKSRPAEESPDSAADPKLMKLSKVKMLRADNLITSFNFTGVLCWNHPGGFEDMLKNW